MSVETTPAQAGHAGLSATAAQAGQRLVDALARSIGPRAAVSWVHAGALLQHAATTGHAPGLHPAPGTPGQARSALEQLAAAHPALWALADPKVCPLWEAVITGDDWQAITTLWREHPVTDPPDRPHGYLLGNAYQALSTEARKHRALAQTPRYVTELLIDLAMRPAWTVWPDEQVRMIDPACGTGHIAVETLIAAYQVAAARRGTTSGATLYTDLGGAVRDAVATVHGVDLDPYAAVLARYRLLTVTAALMDVPLDQVPAHLAPRVRAADALLDRGEPLLDRGRYHAVVMNPPYITPKDARVRDAVRQAYREVCTGKYALSLPFHQLATELLVPGGWCAQLTASSFMKRDFGKLFIEHSLSGQDLRWVIDTSGAYIPGHGTPTVILVHRNQSPVEDTVTTVRGIQGEPRVPDDPSQGLVWQAIQSTVRQRLAEEWLTPSRTPERPTTPAQALAAGPSSPSSEDDADQVATVPQQPQQLDLFSAEQAA